MPHTWTTSDATNHFYFCKQLQLYIFQGSKWIISFTNNVKKYFAYEQNNQINNANYVSHK